MAAAASKPEDRLAFADELAQVRAKDVKNKYKKELNELEVEYQFILLRSLTLFHKEMLRAKLPDRLYEIKENLTDTVGTFDYQTSYARPCRKDSSISMSFSMVFSMISSSPASLDFSSSKLRWNDVIAGSSDFR